ncbi:hypothetical protein B296_00000093 [Ensete ventricosum]|uniref:Uncharacterized protein n=1 Tax=Ensete ventricosum TaxID=4639 RepID=A0A427B2T9_ENSVE|nr:hypothetical protein B296_00000093 [Ensete ventricosum]
MGKVLAEVFLLLLPHPMEGYGGWLWSGAREKVALELPCELIERVNGGWQLTVPSSGDPSESHRESLAHYGNRGAIQSHLRMEHSHMLHWIGAAVIRLQPREAKEGMFPSLNEGSRRAPLEVGCVTGGTSSPGLTGVERSCDIGRPPSSAKVLHHIQGVCTMGFRPRAQEGPDAGNSRSACAAAMVVTLMWILLTSLNCSCKTRPSPGWRVPEEIPPTIKLELFRRVKSDVSCSDVLMKPDGDCMASDAVRPWVCPSICDTSLVCIRGRGRGD